MARKMIVENINGTRLNRVQWNPRSGVRFNRELHFARHERSPFLDRIIPTDYVELSGTANGREMMDLVSDWLVRMARKMTLSTDVETVQYKFVYGQWLTGDKGYALMVPIGATSVSGGKQLKLNAPNVTLEDFGVHIHNVKKAMKYFNRAKAPHKAMVFGKVTDVTDLWDGKEVHFKLDDGYCGVARYILEEGMDDERFAIADGQLRIKTDFYRHVGKLTGMRVRDWSTYSGKVTTLNPFGMGKGYGHSQENLKYDIVAYGPKEAITYDDFMFGVMSDVNPGRVASMDAQSIANFDMWSFMPGAFDQLCKDIVSRFDDEDALRAFFMRHVEAVDSPDSVEGWLLPKKLAMGFSPLAEPSIWREVNRHFMHTITNVERGRIPFERMALRASIVPEPTMFDEYGNVVPEKSRIPEGHMICMDAPVGPTAEYRQPNGHPLEHSRSINYHDHAYEKYVGSQRSFYGRDIARQNAKKNGADADDDQVIVYNPDMVKHFYSLTYQLSAKLEPGEAVRSVTTSYYAPVAVSKTGGFTLDDFVRVLSDARSVTMQLGQVVNMIMLDRLLSGPHKVNMLKDLDFQIELLPDGETRELHKLCRQWLAARPDYQLRIAATNLEAVIDFCTQGKGNPQMFKPIVDLVQSIAKETLVYPRYFAQKGTGFMGEGRIPATKVGSVHYVLASCLLDEQMSVVLSQREAFTEEQTVKEWTCISPVPGHLEMDFAADPAFAAEVNQTKIWWNRMMREMVDIKDRDASRAFYKNVLYGEVHECRVGGVNPCPPNCPDRKAAMRGEVITPGMKQYLDLMGSDEERMFFAVQMKRLVHSRTSPLLSETGKLRHVPDSAFSNALVFYWYMQACKQSDLTGEYRRIDWDLEARRYQDRILWVRIDESGAVYTMEDAEEPNYFLGTVSTAQLSGEGEYRMAYGWICIHDPNVEITRDFPHYGEAIVFGPGQVIEMDTMSDLPEVIEGFDFDE